MIMIIIVTRKNNVNDKDNKRNNIWKRKTRRKERNRTVCFSFPSLSSPFHTNFPISASQGKQIREDGSKEKKNG